MLKELLADKPNAEVFLYPGAQHGFFNAGRADVYDPSASAQAERRAVAMFERSLGA